MSTEERKIVLFPAPPPTTNALSAAQRMRLVRSSKKLGRILGITPHFVDCHGVEEDVGPLAPFAFDDMLSLRSSSRASTDSHSRSSSLSSRASTDSASSTTSSFTSTSSISSRISLPSHDTWPARKPPMLRLALAAPPDLESIPASPVTPHTPRSRPRLTHRRTPPLDGSPSSSPSSSPPSPASLCTDSDPESPHPSPTAPTFTIPHPAAPSMRRAKMDRLRRTLGEGVPLRLVFPPSPSPSSDSEEEGSEPSLSLSLSSGSRSTSEESLNTPSTSPVSESLEEEKDLPRVPHSLHMRSTSELSTRRRKKTGIAHTRDSMVEGGSSPHRAARKSSVVVVASPGLVASRPAPPPPPGSKVRTGRRGSVLRKPVPFYLDAPTPAPPPKDKEHNRKPKPQPKQNKKGAPTVLPHRRSHSSNSGSRLDVIPESPLEKSSEWFGEGDGEEDGFDFEYVGEEEVLEAAMWGWGYGGVMTGDGGAGGYGMGRGLARSYGRV